MLPGWCCIAIAALELRNGDSWYHMCAFRFHFWGRKVNWNQASHVRASSVPTLYACCLTKRSCHFLFVARVGLCCWFCDFAVSFLVPPDGPKNGTVKVLFFYSFTKHAVPKMGPPGGPIFGTVFSSFFEVFCIKVAEAQRFGFNEPFWHGDRKGNCSNSICHFFFVCCTGRPLLLILRFCGLIFGTARRSQKWDRESAFLLFFY